MANFISNVASFNSSVLIPFLEDFFTTQIGFVFVCVCVICAILSGLRSLFDMKF